MATALDTSLLDPSRLRHEIAQFPLVAARRRRPAGAAARAAAGAAAREIQAYFEAGGSAEVVHRELSRQMDAVIQGTLDFAQAAALRHAPTRPRARSSRWWPSAATAAASWRPAPTSTCCSCCPYKRTPHVEQISEFLLYKLWDLGPQGRPGGPLGAARASSSPRTI